jgi:hypothetical protein
MAAASAAADPQAAQAEASLSAALGAFDPLPGLVWVYRVDSRACHELDKREQEAALAAPPPTGCWHWLHFDLGDRRTPRTIAQLSALLMHDGVAMPAAALDDFLRPGSTPELHFT